ncbi:hypothetical protein [Herbidospora mongoliensis]|uniref:hypothetical protein n=1 Tax=Herbidospora mongoliensis TaxID=688067 RepID=UPI0008334098|nr:hypothetical protein [Herbidospora mongoliensis]
MDPAFSELLLTYCQTKDLADLAAARNRAEELGDPHAIMLINNLSALAEGKDRRIATAADNEPLLAMIPAFMAKDLTSLRDAIATFPPDSVTGAYLRSLVMGDIEGLLSAIDQLPLSDRSTLLALAAEGQQELYATTGEPHLRDASIRTMEELARLKDGVRDPSPRRRWWLGRRRRPN